METTLKKPVARNLNSVYANNTIKTIYERRAVRKYIDKPVEKVVIEQIIDAGRMAPSAINRQPWKFYVLTDKKEIKTYSKAIGVVALKGIMKTGVKSIVKTIKGFLHFSHGIEFFKAPDPVFHNAPVVIFITSAGKSEWAPLDIGMCAQNMMLAAKSFGINSCPVGLAKFIENTEEYSKLNIPAAEHIHLAIILGYSDENPEVHERKKNNIVYL